MNTWLKNNALTLIGGGLTLATLVYNAGRTVARLDQTQQDIARVDNKVEKLSDKIDTYVLKESRVAAK